MNAWSINKHSAIKVLLLKLIHQYGENTFALNRQEQHYQAIELRLNHQDSGLVAYIYTFGQDAEKYAIDLKYPISVHNIIGEHENLSLQQILDILSIHFFS